MSDRAPHDIGAVLLWQKCAVMVLSEPHFDTWTSGQHCWRAKAVYLRVPDDSSIKLPVFTVKEDFSIEKKKLFKGELTGEEAALGMRLLLIGDNK